MSRTASRTDDLGDLPTPEDSQLGRLVVTLSPEGQARLRGIARIRVAMSGARVLADGGEPPEVGFVLDGTLSMTKLLPDGRAHLLGLLTPTDMFGRVFGGPARYDVEALSEARLLCVPRGPFEALLTREAGAMSVLLGHALDDLDLAREGVLLLNGSKVVTRLASFLVVLMRRTIAPKASHPSDHPTLQVPLRRADLASYLGTRPETLSRAFHDLEARGILRILDPYRFQITDLPSLIRAAGEAVQSPDPSRPKD